MRILARPTGQALQKGHSARLVHLLLVAGLYALAFGLIKPAVPLFAVSIGASAFVIGAYASVGTAVNALLRPTSGRLSDSTNRQGVMLLGLAIAAVSVTSLLIVRLPWALLGVGAGVGAGAAAFWPSLKAGAVEALGGGERPAAALGVVSSSQFGASAVGQVAGGALLSGAGYRAVFGAAAVCLFGAMAVSGGLRHRPTGGGRETARDTAPVPNGTRASEQPADLTSPRSVTRARLLADGVTLFFLGVAVGGFLPFLPVYMRQVLHANVALIGVSLAVFSGANVLGGLSVDRVKTLSRGLLPAGAVVPVLLAVASGLLVAKGVSPLVGFVAAGALLAFSVTIIQVLVTAGLVGASSGGIARKIGLMDSSTLAGALCGPMVGAAAYASDPRWLFPVCAVSALAAAAVASAAPTLERMRTRSLTP